MILLTNLNNNNNNDKRMKNLHVLSTLLYQEIYNSQMLYMKIVLKYIKLLNNSLWQLSTHTHFIYNVEYNLYYIHVIILYIKEINKKNSFFCITK